MHCASPYLQDHGDPGRSRGQDGRTATDACRVLGQRSRARCLTLLSPLFIPKMALHTMCVRPGPARQGEVHSLLRLRIRFVRPGSWCSTFLIEISRKIKQNISEFFLLYSLGDTVCVVIEREVVGWGEGHLFHGSLCTVIQEIYSTLYPPSKILEIPLGYS